MSIWRSLLWGTPGSFEVLGVQTTVKPVRFDSVEQAPSGLMQRFLESRICQVVTQGYLHQFVHEMGHALAAKWLLRGSGGITIYQTGGSEYQFRHSSRDQPLICIRRSAFLLAGPLADVVFSSSKLILAAAARDVIPAPVSLLLGGSGLLWIAGELSYAAISAIQRTNGDFGRILKQGKSHLCAASAALVGTAAAGIWAAARLLF